MKKKVRLFPNISNLTKTIILLVGFSIAMGMLETIVVVYLRMLYYPEGFSFPLRLINSKVYGIELLRELATLIMIGSISCLAGKKLYIRLAYFLLTFAVWDIFYYIWLKVLLNWPATILDWDVLFLIPIVWVGPVLAPIICSLVMVIISSFIIFLDQMGISVKFVFHEWVFILIGSTMILYTFIIDYSAIIFNNGLLNQLSTLSTNAEFQQRLMKYMPDHYQWIWFGLGITFIVLAIYLFVRRYLSHKSDSVRNLNKFGL